MGWFVALFVLSVVVSSLFSVSTSIDSIMQGQPISSNQTIISSGGTFALGFFTADPSSSIYLGIWYNTIDNSNRTIVWVANRESPLHSSGVFTIGENGNFEVLDGSKKAIWSSNVSVLNNSNNNNNNNTVGMLKDNGNLVLKQGEFTMWESFDHPSHTLLPGMKLSLNQRTRQTRSVTSWAGVDDPRPGNFTLGVDPTGPTQILVWKENHPYWRSSIENGSWTDTRFSRSRGTTFYSSTNFDDEEYYFTYSISEDTTQLMGVLSPTGQIEVLLRLNSSSPWILVRKWPKKTCEFYNSCGPSGACDDKDAQSPCKCLTGFKPKTQKEWDAGNWTDGCVRQRELICDKEEGFLKFELMKLPDYVVSAGNRSVGECKSACLQNCSCSAYAYFNFSEATTVRCLHWFGDLADLVQNVENGRDLYIRVQGSQLSAKAKAVMAAKENKSHLIIALSIAAATAAFLISLIVSTLCLFRKMVLKEEETEQSMTGSSSNIIAGGAHTDIELVMFKFRSILDATDNFSETNKLGEGGFGPVYKANFPGNEVVALKRLSRRSGQGFQEFINELKLIAKLQHTNLVRLLGCCAEKEEKILIYEYMPNRSLDKFLFDPLEGANLDWGIRFQIVEGVAQGLLYLHKYSRLKVIHRDLKASNILLDGAMKPKISDFGMARIFGIDQTEAKTERVVGTYGYMSPEYALYGQFSEKSDVFSFGVLLLEIVSGKKNTDFHRTELSLTILGWAWELWKEGVGMELVDSLIKDRCCTEEVVKCIQIGLLCVQEAPADRPTMSSVVAMLGNESALLPSPKEPAFSTRGISGDSSSQISCCYSNYEGTMSMPEPR